MKIQMGVTQKMKLYNVYRLCKKYIVLFNVISIKQESNSSNQCIKNWTELKNILQILEKVPALKIYANSCIDAIPDTVRHTDEFRLSDDTYREFAKSKNVLLTKMKNIIELYESLNIENEGCGIDIKFPPCDDLKDYISYLKDIDFIFSQCPFLQCEGELLKFGSVDVGSNWIKLTVATATTCFILTNAASLIDKAIMLRSHYITLQQQEEMLKSYQMKNELAEENVETFNTLRTAAMNIVIKQLEKESGKSLNPEELDKAERSLEKIVLLLDKGCEIYATLDSPDDVQSLFPEIQGNLELPDSIIKYLEDKQDNLENQE